MWNKFNLKRDTLQMDDLPRLNYDKITDFADFVANVQLDYSTVDASPLKEIIDRFPVQWVLPMKNLCMRYINQLKVINNIHVLFVAESIKKSCYTQALPIINSQAFPFKMQSREQQYTYCSFVIFFKLGYYNKAFKKIQSLASKRSFSSKNPQIFFFSYILMCRIFNQAFINEQLIKQALRGGSRFVDVSQLKACQQNQLILDHLMNYARRQGQYSKQVIEFLIKTDKYKVVQQIYELGLQENGKLRSEVQSYKGDKYERIKLSDIKNQPLSNPKNMREINLLSNQGKYDCKQRILYLNHEKFSSDEINDLISKCYQLGQTVKNAGTIKEHQLGGRFRLGGGMSGLSNFLERMGGGGRS